MTHPYLLILAILASLGLGGLAGLIRHELNIERTTRHVRGIAKNENADSDPPCPL